MKDPWMYIIFFIFIVFPVYELYLAIEYGYVDACGKAGCTPVYGGAKYWISFSFYMLVFIGATFFFAAEVHKKIGTAKQKKKSKGG